MGHYIAEVCCDGLHILCINGCCAVAPTTRTESASTNLPYSLPLFRGLVSSVPIGTTT